MDSALKGRRSEGLSFTWLDVQPGYQALPHWARPEAQLGKVGVLIVKVNSLQALRLAEIIGQCAKTDAIDAAILARFGEIRLQADRNPGGAGSEATTSPVPVA